MIQTVMLPPTAPIFESLNQPARYKAAWGGRGSGKSHNRASALIEESCNQRGLLSVCIREIQRSLRDSAKRLIESKLAKAGLGTAHGFKIYADRIQTPGDGIIIFQGMQDHTAESIKSLEGFRRAWVEEAQTLSARSLELLRPTIRAPGSELWFTWNPRRKTDPVDRMFRGETPPTGSIVVKANWYDNPWLPAELKQERLDCLNNSPDSYDHIWEGGYAAIGAGAYYAADLTQARREGRICRVDADPAVQLRAFWDIGFRDATAIWVAQYVGREIRVLRHYEAAGQPLASHLNWLRDNGYGDALCVLPHDGSHADAISGARFEDHIRSAGFAVQTIRNQGKGAALKRIESARRLFPCVRIDEAGCAGGLDALGWYHERKDDARGIGLGPAHDWSSHAADAWGLMCVAYEEPAVARDEGEDWDRGYVGPGGWML